MYDNFEKVLYQVVIKSHNHPVNVTLYQIRGITLDIDTF